MPQLPHAAVMPRTMTGHLNRRQMLSLGLRLGLASPLIATLMASA